MKVVANGGLNISVLDGWWDEAYDSGNGWAVGNGEVYDDPEYQDEVESLSIYNILEEEVIPLFYRRGDDGLPSEWLAGIRASMKTIIPEFNTNRMVKDYAEKYYQAGHHNYNIFSAESFKLSRQMAAWKEIIKSKWTDAEIIDINIEQGNDIRVGSKVKVQALVKLGSIVPEEVMVELFFGSINKSSDIPDGVAAPMHMIMEKEKGTYLFEGHMLCLNSGRFGYSIRVKPHKAEMVRKFDPELPLTWA
jgi:starch phosphorylase